jgi:hypothetical protein
VSVREKCIRALAKLGFIGCDTLSTWQLIRLMQIAKAP